MKARISIDTAIEALQKNLDEHIVEFRDAVDVWTADAKNVLDDLAKAFDREGLKASTAEFWKIWHTMPVDTRAQYSKFLGMLKRAKEGGETHIEADEDDYDCIFQDNWDWRRASKVVNATYSSRK